MPCPKIRLPTFGRKKDPIGTPQDAHPATAVTSPSVDQTAARSPTSTNASVEDSGPKRQANPLLPSSGKASVPPVFPAEPTTPLTPGSGDAAQDGVAQRPEIADGDEIGDPDGENNKKLNPISELWDEAYDELCACEEKKDLMLDYEEQLSKFVSGHKDAKNLTQRRRRQEEMKVVIDRKTEELKEGKWKVSFGDHSLVLADLVQKVVGIIDWAKTFVGSAVQVSPPASLAWAGVCLLLPLVLNSGQQEAFRVQALDDIACIVSQCFMRETVYHIQYESDEKSVHGSSEYHSSHVRYREALKMLYTKILTFQATWVCFFSENGFKRVMKDSVKLVDWEPMFTKIKQREENLKGMDERWRDTTYQEKWKVQNEQHHDRVRKLDELKSELVLLNKAIEDTQRQAERKELLNWLTEVGSSPDHVSTPSTYNLARGKRHSATSGWLVDKLEAFHKWKDSPNSLLWLHGKAGAGKSVLSSAVIQHLDELHPRDPCTATAYFFFDFRDERKQNFANMARSLIAQLSARRPDTPESLQSLRPYCDQKIQPPNDDLLKAIKATTEGFSNVYLIIDALDECPEAKHQRDELLSMLGTIHKWTKANLHVLLTSRKVPSIERKLESLIGRTPVPGTGVINLELHQSDIDGDITVFIEDQLEKGNYQFWDEDVKVEIKDTLVEKANGMFQYVVAQFDSENLTDAGTDDDVSKALKELPKDLDDTYERALLKLSGLNREKAVVCLTWIAFAPNPLTVAELVAAVGLGLSNEPPPLTDEEDSKPKISEARLQVLLLPPGLVVVDEKVSFSHFSVKEYLISDRIKSSEAREFALNEQAAHIQIAQACLRYHLYISKEKAQNEITDPILREFRLWDYAGEFGLGHVESVARDQWTPSLCGRLQDVFEHRGVAFRNLVWLQRDWLLASSDPDNFKFPSPLYYTIYMGYGQLFGLLLESSPSLVNALGGRYGTALNLACRAGMLDAMEILLDAGADPYLGCWRCKCALHASFLTFGSNKRAKEKLLGLPGMLERCAELGYVRLSETHFTLLLFGGPCHDVPTDLASRLLGYVEDEDAEDED